MLRDLPTSELVTEDFATAKRRTRQVRREPPPLANLGARYWPTAPCIAVAEVPLDRLVPELVWLGWRSVDAATLRAEGKGFLAALPLLYLLALRRFSGLRFLEQFCTTCKTVEIKAGGKGKYGEKWGESSAWKASGEGT